MPAHRSAQLQPCLILASSSPYRRELLARIFPAFQAHAPAVDETPRPGETARDLALRLAGDKARMIAHRYPETLVIGSDQAAACGEVLLGKPGEVERACAQLAQVSGRTVVFHTAVALANSGDLHLVEVPTTVRFRELDRDHIRRYVSRDRPLDCAGSIRAEALGISLVESIQSEDPTALLGLPLIATARLLREAGIEIP